MTAKDVIRLSLNQTKGRLTSLLADMKDQPTVAPTPRGGNHPLWVLGHLAYAEAGLVSGFIKGEANPLAKWEKLFGMGSQPLPDASKYPAWDELVSEYEQVRANTLRLLDTYSDADFDRPSKAPENLSDVFGTVIQVFLVLSSHTAFHAGQVADARRAAGKKPLMG
jgi:hypothetical protein